MEMLYQNGSNKGWLKGCTDMTKIEDPITNCKHKNKQISIMCDLMGMSCAMFHTRIAAHPIKVCVYREEKVIG